MTPRSFTALLIASCGFSVACGDRPTSGTAVAAATIDTIGDTIRVRTGPGAAPVLRLEPEVRIGAVDGAAAYLLGRISAIVEGPAGGIYICDVRHLCTHRTSRG